MKKIVVLFLSLCLIFSLVACGNAGSSEKASSGSEAASDDTGASAGGAVKDTNWEGAEKAATLSGKITYMHWGDDYEREMYANLFAA